MAAHLSPINILSHCVKFVDLLLPARLFNLTFPLYVCLPYFAEMPFDLSLTRGMLTSNEVETIPDEFSLGQNYPNPFNPTTNIAYQLPASANVTLTVYDITGREVASFAEGRKAAGSYTITFDASKLSSGMYIYRIQAGNFSATKKMMLIK